MKPDVDVMEQVAALGDLLEESKRREKVAINALFAAKILLKTKCPCGRCGEYRAVEANKKIGEALEALQSEKEPTPGSTTMRNISVVVSSPQAATVDMKGSRYVTSDDPNRKPTPCLDPDKMHGAGDQFGGSDY